MIAPSPRPQVYDLYWYFASERQVILERRLAGQPNPWTSDPILQTYKFCNAFRATDRVSQYLIREVCYGGETVTGEDRLFQIVAFRFFSSIATWRSVRQFLGCSPTLANLADGSFRRALEHTLASEGKLYTGAFILCAADAYGEGRKYLNHVALFQHMFLTDGLGQKLLAASSLREVYQLLHDYPLIGDFMAYQIAIDLNYSDLVNFSENEFTQAGPGALRGIKKCFTSLGSYSPSDIIAWMVDNQAAEFARLGLPPARLFGRRLHAIDCQGLFCETDKYCRQAVPELASARTHIKARYHENPLHLRLFFPPKWDINENISC